MKSSSQHRQSNPTNYPASLPASQPVGLYPNKQNYKQYVIRQVNRQSVKVTSDNYFNTNLQLQYYDHDGTNMSKCNSNNRQTYGQQKLQCICSLWTHSWNLKMSGIVAESAADTAHRFCVLVDVVLVAAIVATNQRILHVYATLSMRLRIIRNFLSVPVLFLFVFVILCFLCHI